MDCQVGLGSGMVEVENDVVLIELHGMLAPPTSQGHNFHKLLFSIFQKYYILDDGGKVSVLW